ncbi:Bug family tripartite tricarboxylate transporter substrate binding protein [Paralcaligenes ginsengisoli]
MTVLKKPNARRRSLITAGAASLFLPAFARGKGKWPEQPIKIVVPFAPGGSNDIIARLLAAKMGARMSNPILVENRGGAGGTIGTEYVTKAAPDGYTLLFASTSITTNSVSKKLRYDLAKDLDPIGAVATSPFAVVVSNTLPVKTLAEFIALAKSKPGSINYGSAGVGGINHLGTELFAHAAGIKLTHVPYKGISLAFTDLLGGELQMLLPTVASSVQQIQEGRMRGLAVTGAKRSPLLPNLPTVSEAGLPGFQLEAWFGLFGPAKMPTAIVKRLNTELNAVLEMDDVKKHLALEGATATPGTPQALGELVRSELERWRSLIKEADIHLQ